MTKSNITDPQAAEAIEWLQTDRKQSVWSVDEIGSIKETLQQVVWDIETEMDNQTFVNRGSPQSK